MADYATLLRDRVTLSCRSVDRIFLQGYEPKLQSVGLMCRSLHWQRKSCPPRRRSARSATSTWPRFTSTRRIMTSRWCISTGKRNSAREKIVKEEVARPFLDAAAKEGGSGWVVLLGIAQEKASVWRSWKAKDQEKARHPHMEWGRQVAMVNHFYWYIWIRSGAERSSRPTPTPLSLAGCRSMVIPGPSASWIKRVSATRRSTTGSYPAPIPRPCSGSATGWGQGW